MKRPSNLVLPGLILVTVAFAVALPSSAADPPSQRPASFTIDQIFENAMRQLPR